MFSIHINTFRHIWIKFFFIYHSLNPFTVWVNAPQKSKLVSCYKSSIRKNKRQLLTFFFRSICYAYLFMCTVPANFKTRAWIKFMMRSKRMIFFFQYHTKLFPTHELRCKAWLQTMERAVALVVRTFSILNTIILKLLLN